MQGYGYAVLPDQNATADTQYLTGSTTKAFTAAAAGLLVHDQSYPDIKWTTPIQHFIPNNFALEDDYATAHTTVEDALSHRTGLPRHDLIEGQANDTISKLVSRMRYLPTTAEPRTLYQYCNNMYAVMAHMLQTILGQDFETILANSLWKPLGMLSTTFNNPFNGDAKQSHRLARGYYWNVVPNVDCSVDGEGKYIPEPYESSTANPGAGGIYSTVNDYALWINALLDTASGSRPTNLSSPISPQLLHDLFTPRSIVPETEYELDSPNAFITPPLYGLGWFTLQIGGETLVLHGGVQTGFGAEVYMLPGRSFGIVTMANTQGTSNTAGNIIAFHLMKQKLTRTHGSEEAISEPGVSFAGLSKSTSRLPRSRRAQSMSPPKRQNQTLHHKAMPLPRPLSDFAGLYSHPAYGPINFTTTISHTSSPPHEILEGLFYPRLNPVKVELFHSTDTAFIVRYFSPHGLGDVVTGDGIVWEHLTSEDGDDAAEARAFLTLGLNGDVEAMGIEIEEAMVEMAREKGERYWRDGMIWFNKI